MHRYAMDFPNIFTREVSQKVIDRINNLTPETKPGWGKMDCAQMLAHCNVAYELVYDSKHPKPGFLMKIILKAIAKKTVTGTAPYKRNTVTAPAFKIVEARDFGKEKQRLTDYIKKTAALGEKEFDGKESHSFGVLTLNEWNTMFYKHLDHHLTQFGI